LNGSGEESTCQEHHEIDNVTDTLLSEAEYSKEPSQRRLSWYDYRDSQIQPERAVAAHRY